MLLRQLVLVLVLVFNLAAEATAAVADSSRHLADDADDGEATACSMATTDLHNKTEYVAVYEDLEAGMMSIKSSCVFKEDFEQCVGALPDVALTAFEAACTDPSTLNGTVVELARLRTTCRPSSGNATFVLYEKAVECVASICDEDEVEAYTESYLESVNDAAEEVAGDTRCSTEIGSGTAMRSVAVAAATVIVAMFAPLSL